MDPLDFLGPEELLRFFRCHKTELSCMESPRIFINQLRDHNLIPEDRYKRMIRMKSKDNMKQTLYEVLDWLEREQSQFIKGFWMCVFKEPIMFHYPTLRMLRNSLMDGSFHFGTQLPEKVEKEETEKGKRNELSGCEEEDEREENSVKKKRKLRSSGTFEEEQASTSSPSAPSQRRKSNKICFSAEGEDENENEESDPDKEDQAASSSKESSTDVTASPLKKGEKNDIWTWPIYKLQLPVTCGKENGMLNRDKLAKGEKCIMHKKLWFTPSQFETLAGKQSCKNWKLSIQCRGNPLRKLIQEGHLKSTKFKRECKKAMRSLFPSDDSTTAAEGEDENENEESDPDKEDQTASSSKESSTDVTDEEGEMEKQTEQQPEASHGGSKKVFTVTCGTLAGSLHGQRFASGTHGKSIRTEISWMTPVEFMDMASCKRDVSWRKDITYEGKPLGVLIEANILRIHSVHCICPNCKPDSQDLEDQKNDDECFICKSEQEPFVVCDQCPRSFHQNCHLPHIEDNIMGDGALWLCTFCVYRSNIELYFRYELTREAAMSLQISQCMLECQYLLLHLWGADKEQTFATDPGLDLPDYSTVIKTPMWLGNIADKLQRQRYQTVGEFVSDVQLIFTNSATYNRENAEFLAKGDRLKKLFDKEWKNMFNICD